jgi:hypothetical protein
MNAARFLVLTASDAWLTAVEILMLLDQGGYWSGAYVQATPDVRLTHVIRRLETLSDAASRPLFDSMVSLGPDGQTVRVYKQARLIRPAQRGRRPRRRPR